MVADHFGLSTQPTNLATGADDAKITGLSAHTRANFALVSAQHFTVIGMSVTDERFERRFDRAGFAAENAIEPVGPVLNTARQIQLGAADGGNALSVCKMIVDPHKLSVVVREFQFGLIAPCRFSQFDDAEGQVVAKGGENRDAVSVEYSWRAGINRENAESPTAIRQRNRNTRSQTVAQGDGSPRSRIGISGKIKHDDGPIFAHCPGQRTATNRVIDSPLDFRSSGARHCGGSEAVERVAFSYSDPSQLKASCFD